MQKGHNPNVKEQDIGYGFKMFNRTEKFDVSMEDIDAHTFKIMEIIEQEKSNLKQRQMQGLNKDASS